MFQHLLAELDAALVFVHEFQKCFLRKLTECLLKTLLTTREVDVTHDQSQIPWRGSTETEVA